MQKFNHKHSHCSIVYSVANWKTQKDKTKYAYRMEKEGAVKLDIAKGSVISTLTDFLNIQANKKNSRILYQLISFLVGKNKNVLTCLNVYIYTIKTTG